MNQTQPNPASIRLNHAATVAEEIASRDNNNLYRTSRFFRDGERYRAFCAYYAIMRVVDDRIDSLPSRAALTNDERAIEHRILASWRQAVVACTKGEFPDFGSSLEEALDHPQAEDLLIVLVDAFQRFPVPIDFWNNFFDAMAWDLDRQRFATYAEFLQYTEGATVAPTTIYLYLLVAQKQSDGRYQSPPGFDLFQCGRALGRFAYLGHILRDLPEDLETGKEGVLFLAADDMRRFHLTEAKLFADLAAGRSGEALRKLTAELVRRGRHALGEGLGYLDALKGRLESDCAFILRLIIAIYGEVLNKIEKTDYNLLAREHRLTDDEKNRIVIEIAQQTGFS
jgi:phytoene/squalene synthetase